MIIDKLAWLHIKDGKLLAVRSKGKSLFYLPGGKREAGESDQQALLREISEELSVTLEPSTLRYAGTFSGPADGKAAGVTVQLTCYFAGYQGELTPDMEIEELKYLSTEDRAITSIAAWVVMAWLQEQALI